MLSVRLGAAATAIVALGSGILSWDALSWGAGQLGVDGHLTWLYPVVIDGTICVGTVCALALRGARYRIRAYVWVLLAGAVGASVVGNGAHAAGGNPLHVVGAAVPAIALAASLHLLVILVRHAPAARVEPGDLVSDVVAAAAAAPSLAAVTAPAPPIAAAIAADIRPAIAATALAELVAVPAVMPVATTAASSRPSVAQPDDRETAAVPAAGGSLDGRAADDQVVTAEAPGPGPRAGREAGREAGRPAATTDDRSEAPAMTAAAAKQAAVRMVRRAQSGGRPVTAEDIRKATRRSARQARRLLTEAEAEVGVSPARRPRVLTTAAAPAAAVQEGRSR